MTPEAQATWLQELGYAGIGYTGTEGIPKVLRALDERGLRMFSIYVGGTLSPDGPSYDLGLQQAMAHLQGR